MPHACPSCGRTAAPAALSAAPSIRSRPRRVVRVVSAECARACCGKLSLTPAGAGGPAANSQLSCTVPLPLSSLHTGPPRRSRRRLRG
jgi:hypothetical protein